MDTSKHAGGDAPAAAEAPMTPIASHCDATGHDDANEASMTPELPAPVTTDSPEAIHHADAVVPFTSPDEPVASPSNEGAASRQRNWAMAKTGATELVARAASARELALAKAAKAAAARAAAEQAVARAAEARALAAARAAQSLTIPSPPPSPGEDEMAAGVGLSERVGQLNLRQSRLRRRSPSPPPSPGAEDTSHTKMVDSLSLQQSRLPSAAAVALTPPAAAPSIASTAVSPFAASNTKKTYSINVLNSLEKMSGKDLDHDGDVGKLDSKDRAAVKIQALQRGKSVRRISDVKQFVRIACFEPMRSFCPPCQDGVDRSR